MDLSFLPSSLHKHFGNLLLPSVVFPLPTTFEEILDMPVMTTIEGIDGECSTSEDDQPPPPAVELPRIDWLEQMVARAHRHYDDFFIKVCGTSLKDAAWAAPLGLCASSYDEVLLLLQASELVATAVERTKRLGLPLEIEFRQWCTVQRAFEFRCLVCDNHLVVICQRYLNDLCPQLAHAEERAALQARIAEFFVTQFFPRNFPERDCHLLHRLTRRRC